DGFGVLIPRVEPFPILGTLFASSLFPGRAPDDHVTLATYVGGTREPALALESDAALVAAVVPALRVLLGVRGAPTFVHRTTHARAIPQYELGHDRIIRATEGIERRNPGLVLAGTYRDGIAVGDAVASGARAAERVERFLAATLRRSA